MYGHLQQSIDTLNLVESKSRDNGGFELLTEVGEDYSQVFGEHGRANSAWVKGSSFVGQGSRRPQRFTPSFIRSLYLYLQAGGVYLHPTDEKEMHVMNDRMRQGE